jgi:predicted SAM-dependent methyltransferase
MTEGKSRYGGTEIKLNLGCGGRPLPGYINVDMDSIEELKERYPFQNFSESLIVYNYDIFNLPFHDGSVTEIKAHSLIEHLSFIDEPRFFYEVKRVLKQGGIFEFSTPDFEDAVRLWLNAKDEWKDFYRNDPESIAQEHWFGQYSYSTDNRWGYLMAMIFGSQNGAGQFHNNGYSVAKIRAILKHIDFEELEVSRYRWKEGRDLMILVRSAKR